MTAGLALLASVLWGSSDFVGGLLTRRLPAPLVVLTSQAAAFVAACSAALVVLAVGAGPGGWAWLGWGMVAGLAGPLALVSFYWALAGGTMGVVAPVAALGILVPVVAGLGAGENPRVPQLVGIAAAVLGVVLASGPDVRGGGAAARSVGLALVAAVGFGLVLVFLAHGGRSSVALTLVAQRGTGVGTLALARLLLARRRQPPRAAAATADPPAGGGPDGRGRTRTGRRDRVVLCLLGVCDLSANAVYAVATRHGLVSVVAVLASLYPVATVLLARQVLHERLRRVQLAGVLGVLAGVVLLAGG